MTSGLGAWYATMVTGAKSSLKKIYNLGLTLTFFTERLNFSSKTSIGRTLKIVLSENRRPRPLVLVV